MNATEATKMFLNAWKTKDYQGMVNASQPSYLKYTATSKTKKQGWTRSRTRKNNPEKRMIERFGDKKLTSYSIVNVIDETKKLNAFLKSKKAKNRFELICKVRTYVEYIYNNEKYKKIINLNAIMENGEVKINPTSALKEVSM